MRGEGNDDLHKKDSVYASMHLNCNSDLPVTDGISWIHNVPLCPTFYPTLEEFEDPLSYIESISPIASKYGICKIVSPISPSVPAGVVLMKEKSGFKFTTRVQPFKIAKWDFDDQSKYYMSGRKYSLREYEKTANKLFAHRFSTFANLPAKFIEKEFWKDITSNRTEFVEYACDVEGSAFSRSADCPLGASKWNLQNISRLKKSILHLLNSSIPGVTEPMLYIGMLFSMFAWHVEDHYLYSINYHHCGASKTWYGVPGHAAYAFETVVLEHMCKGEMIAHKGVDAAFDLLAGKTTMFPPGILCEHGVPVYRALQEPGDFIVTFPQAYHAGFSHGFNCGEAVNFALSDWFPFGEAACERYRALNRLQILPHEQLLCEAAMLLATENLIVGVDSLYFVKLLFVRLMKLQYHLCLSLKQQGANIFFFTPSYANNILCSVCNSWCYIAFSLCQSKKHCTCLNHAMRCGCGGMLLIYVRENIGEMEAAAHWLAQEQGILNDVLKELPDFVKEHNENVSFSQLISEGNKKLNSSCRPNNYLSHTSQRMDYNGKCCQAIKSPNVGDTEPANDHFSIKRQCTPPFNRVHQEKKSIISDAENCNLGCSKVKSFELPLLDNAALDQKIQMSSSDTNCCQTKGRPLRIRLKIKGPSQPIKMT